MKGSSLSLVPFVFGGNKHTYLCQLRIIAAESQILSERRVIVSCVQTAGV